ncbi:unnamed protein product [Leptosia nina]|uniref:C2H2-type domain-containing protein n=1 Tax=Leptosia nina TaxID=320188 RepID=A0AAV1JHL2_9NEOP
MESKSIRMVKVIPVSKIKRELPSSDEDDDSVACNICTKIFSSEKALSIHSRFDHPDAVLRGEVIGIKAKKKSSVNLENKKKAIKKAELKEQIRLKTEKLVSSMEPTDIMTMASADVSYIIIKDGQDSIVKEVGSAEPKAKRQKIVKIKSTPKKEKEVKPITGPFECLQPSTLVSNATCHQMFFSCCEYSIHYRDEHTRRRKGIKCQVCEKPLEGSGEKDLPYSCPYCGVEFQFSHALSEHTSTAHKKIKPYQCSKCSKRFTQQGGLQQHMRSHTGDRPFSCTYCPKAFTQKSGLDQHLRIHTKTKPYKCVICSKAFCQSVHLQQHMRTHTNVAPFQCIVCEKRFKQSSHLNYHLKYHNPLNMSGEQKEKYKELMKKMGKEGVFDLIGEKDEVVGDNDEVVEENAGVTENDNISEDQEIEYVSGFVECQVDDDQNDGQVIDSVGLLGEVEALEETDKDNIYIVSDG